MNNFKNNPKALPWVMALLMSVVIAGCGGGSNGQSPVLGVGSNTVAPITPPIVPPVVPPVVPPGSVAPTVTAVAPINNAQGVPVNNTIITAAFSEPMKPITGAASFTVTCGAPCVSPTGTVALDSTNVIATFALAPAATLSPSTVYTATVTGASSIATGLSMAQPYTWQFTTGLVLSATRPTVTITVPVTSTPGPTLAVPANTAISAVFSTDMAPATITGNSFTLSCAAPCVAPTGVVSYAVGSRTAVFLPAAPLTPSSTYTATITSAVTDLTGNALAGDPTQLPAASNYVWTFTTAAAVPVANVTVQSIVPQNNASTTCPGASVNATFLVPGGLRMNPTTITSANFIVADATLTPITAASVVLDGATGTIATFTPQALLNVGTTYTATIKGGATGVMDMAVPGDTMAADYKWTFTVASCIAPPPPPPAGHLGSASTFGIMATSAITNTGAATIINGDVALSPGSSNGLLPAQVNGTIHLNDNIAHQADADLLAGYNYYKGLPPGTTITGGADLGALYPLGMPPGTYTSGSTMLVATKLVLDAKGDANAVWVFQIGSSLTTTTPLGSISLVNGAQAKNVFWVPSASATIGVGTTFYGTVLAGVSATGQTGAVINGRLLAGAVGPGTVALDTNTVNVPAP